MDERHQRALRMKHTVDSQFFHKGLVIAILSGISYGLFTAFLNLGLDTGIWARWADGALSAFAIIYIVSAMGNALMYTWGAVWSLLLATLQGKLGDYFRSLWTKPGRQIILAAFLGGPVAGTSYVIALQQVGSIVIPITALSTAIGSVLGWALYKQKLSPRIICGIVICFVASMMIAGESLLGDAPQGMAGGVIMAFVAAFGWGLEGCLAGYATSMVDYQIGITIRQLTGGLTNLIIVVPALSLIGEGSISYGWTLLAQGVSDAPALAAFAASGFFAMFAYSLWYKGNSMVGAALGMAASGAYAFWAPFFSWILLGVVGGRAGWDIPLIGWVAAIVMVIGIFIIAVNPLTLFKKKEDA